MVADQQEKRIVLAKGRRAVHGMPLSQRRRLFDERQLPRVCPCGRPVGAFVPRADHHADLLDSRPLDLLDDDGERRLGHPVAIDQGLEWKHALVFPGGGNEGLANFHGEVGGASFPKKRRSVNQRRRIARR